MQRVFRLVTLAALVLSLFGLGAVTPTMLASSAAGPTVHPLVAEWQFISAGTTPPDQAQCHSVGRRCFAPVPMANAYNVSALWKQGFKGKGITIAVVDSWGSDTMANDLKVFNDAFGLQHLCGEPGVTCTPDMPTFNVLHVQGAPATKAPPPTSQGTGLQDKSAWALEVSLDVEWAHAIAPEANILLVATPPSETLGVQGLPTMMNAIEYVVDNNLADVISMSFGTGEGAFHQGTASIANLRKAFVKAADAKISLFASSGDGGSFNTMKQPVKNPAPIPYPSVIWPASDPLVTAAGGTYLCVDAVTGLTVDATNPPTRCKASPNFNTLQLREPGWLDSGGGYSIVFGRPAYQQNLPAGSSFVGSSVGAPGPNQNMRGIPDISWNASATTGVLVFLTLPPDGQSGLICGNAPCSTGWYAIGGTSASSPQWAGLTAIADQKAGRRLGSLNPALYAIAANPAKYAADFFDVTNYYCNQTDASVPGYCPSAGWDAVTGLGSPNAVNLVPDLIAATP